MLKLKIIIKATFTLTRIIYISTLIIMGLLVTFSISDGIRYTVIWSTLSPSIRRALDTRMYFEDIQSKQTLS